MIFGDTEKEAFRRLMWRMAKFSGLRILTYAVMGKPFHILVSVPNQEVFVARFKDEGGEARLFAHLELLYSKEYIAQLRRELADFRERGILDAAEALLKKFSKGSEGRRVSCDFSGFGENRSWASKLLETGSSLDARRILLMIER